MDITWILAGALGAIVLLKIFSAGRTKRLINKIPGPAAYPFIGNLLEIVIPTTEVIAKAVERRRKYGKIVRLWLGSIPIVVLAAPEYIETILSNSQEIKKGFTYRLVSKWLGEGLLTSTGQRWFKHRKLITPTFHFKILESFIPIFEQKGQILVKRLQEPAKKGEPFDIYPYITLCALDIIGETAMGTNLHAQEASQSEYTTAVYRVARLVAERAMRVYHHPDFIYHRTSSGKEYLKCVETLHSFTNKVILDRIEHRKTLKSVKETSDDFGVKKKKAFLDLLLDQETDLTEKDLREEVDTFMFEGHDTTTTGISWTLFLLGLNPEIQEQAAEEVAAVWQEGEELTSQILSEMKLLERIIKESLRVYSSVPFISRHLTHDMQIGEYLIPKGTNLNIAISVMHMDEDIYPNPKKFDPDRFLPENVAKRHTYSYIPFSAGPRNCIGQKFALQEERAILAILLREFKITSLDKPEDMLSAAEIVQRPENGVRVKLSRRKQ